MLINTHFTPPPPRKKSLVLMLSFLIYTIRRIYICLYCWTKKVTEKRCTFTNHNFSITVCSLFHRFYNIVAEKCVCLCCCHRYKKIRYSFICVRLCLCLCLLSFSLRPTNLDLTKKSSTSGFFFAVYIYDFAFVLTFFKLLSHAERSMDISSFFCCCCC